MRLHEYQAKRIFSDAGIDTPRSHRATCVEEIASSASSMGFPVAVKAQVHVGGRGKAGGIKIVEDVEEARSAAKEIMGMELKGETVNEVLVEKAVDFEQELYVGITMDRSAGAPVAMVSSKGGVDIEEVAKESPEDIARVHIDPGLGLLPYQARKAAYAANVPKKVAFDVADILQSLYDIWEDNDATEVEINPLMVTSDDDVVAADAVMNIDDDSLFRQPDLAELKEKSYGSEFERKASNYECIDYVRLDGNVGIIGNGAGLVMTTLDLVDHYGGEPANFLDIGGGAKADRVAHSLELVFADPNVDAVVINIFGGITRCDEVAKGINEIVDQYDEPPKPLVVRLDGTNAEKGCEILHDENIVVEQSLEDVVKRAVESARKVKA
ncbi:ADP-forming succinate--CoA ligase subunit beta [Halanaeroarchaeum sulfurireducens]|uniref:Succinate--CoA ligase [ADP-forming] subunit beta n=1 Tax=Halanaeroarchaeum sulfurireducens TaxID=1604004 RepID=A0A0F7PDD0_9EURY|nr:ADP-forming succinate--CoA ligase subunit beta [Halanaeroarchaeum sulfurireducens]AKH98175.1 succinyl-CoA synthetase subunit beta [Halanaeroarchaeum sulfurireducens]